MATETATSVATVLKDIQPKDDTSRVYYGSGGYRLSRPILIGEQAKKTFDAIPTVDVSAIFSEDLATRQAIAREVAKVAEEVGFFYAINPPVPYEKMDAALEATKKLFRLSQEDLLKIHVDNSQCVKGYLPFTFRDGTNSRASFSFGRDYTNKEQHFIKKAADGTISVNQWPEALPEFRQVMYEYYQEVFKFSKQLLQIFSLALGLEETALNKTFEFPMTDITMQYYPIQDPNDQSSISPHADYGGLTILYQDDIGGLEVLNANGIWVPAPPKKHAYIINTGSYMEVLSNGRFPATVHRAFGNPKKERFSVPFFYNPDPVSVIAPHPDLVPKGEKPRFEPQNVSRRTVKGVMTNRANHPFLKKLRALDLKEDELEYDLLFMPWEKIVASKSH